MLEPKHGLVFAAILAVALGSNELEWTCREQRMAAWSFSSSSCLVHFNQNLSWADAMYFCGRADTVNITLEGVREDWGIRGRLIVYRGVTELNVSGGVIWENDYINYTMFELCAYRLAGGWRQEESGLLGGGLWNKAGFKPARSFGRLLHIQSPEMLSFVGDFLPPQPYWIGMRSSLKGSPEFLAHWRWMEDLFTPRTGLPWNPGPSVAISIGRQQQCLRYEPGNWVETGCDNQLPFVCEYLPEPAHFCATQNESLWVPSSASCLVTYSPHLPWTEAMTYCAKKAPPGLIGRLAHLDNPDIIRFLKGRLPRQYLWIGMKSSRRRSKDLARDWRWMSDPLTPLSGPSLNLPDYIRVDLNQEWADCMNILDDRLNDYFCHEALPFLCEFTLPPTPSKDTAAEPDDKDTASLEDNQLHRDIAATLNSVNQPSKHARTGDKLPYLPIKSTEPRLTPEFEASIPEPTAPIAEPVPTPERRQPQPEPETPPRSLLPIPEPETQAAPIQAFHDQDPRFPQPIHIFDVDEPTFPLPEPEPSATRQYGPGPEDSFAFAEPEPSFSEHGHAHAVHHQQRAAEPRFPEPAPQARSPERRRHLPVLPAAEPLPEFLEPGLESFDLGDFPEERHRQFAPRNISGVEIFSGLPGGLVRRRPTEPRPTEGLMRRRPTEPRTANQTFWQEVWQPPRPQLASPTQSPALPPQHFHSAAEPRAPVLLEPRQAWSAPVAHQVADPFKTSAQANINVPDEVSAASEQSPSFAWGPPVVEQGGWDAFTPLPPQPNVTAYVPWEHPRTRPTTPTTPTIPTTTEPPTTTFDARPATEKLWSYCLGLENGVWSDSLQSCFVWFRRARDWDGAMEQCMQESPRSFSVGRLAHIRSDETVELIRSHISARSRLFWVAAKRMEAEGPGPLDSWRWMDNHYDFIKGARSYDPRSMGVRLRLGQADSSCLVWRGSSWAATPCHFYVSFLCEFLPYDL